MTKNRLRALRQLLEYGYAVVMFELSEVYAARRQALSAVEGPREPYASPVQLNEAMVWFISGGLILSLLHLSRIF